MVRFSPVELSDKAWVDEIIRLERPRSADFHFANIYIWDLSFRQEIARIGDRMVVKPKYANHPFYAFPVGGGDLRPVIEALHNHAGEHDFPFRIRGVTTEHIAQLEDLFPGRFEFAENRAFFDYIYSAEKLITLSGKKLHGKRNHINRFLEDNPDWSFQPMSGDLIPACKEMLDSWELMNQDEKHLGLEREHAAIIRAFDNFEALGLEGGVLFSGGRIVAFTIGELICGDTFNVNFEKAFPDVQGAYPMVNREFIRQVKDRHPEALYINREDDMGRENLRKAKMSYYPEFMIEKYTATWSDNA